MDIQAYISSGIIEAYVLGLASAEEVREVEAYAAKYAEVQAAIQQFEASLENELLQNAAPPPPQLKDKILAALQNESNTTSDATAQSVTPAPASSAKVVPITTAPKSVRWLRSAVAACIILLLGSIILNFYYYSQYKKYNDEYKTLVAQQNTLMARNDAYRASFNMMNDTAVIKVTMPAASEKRSGSVATVFWNKQTSDVYLTVNHLPKPTAGKQYQLWAIVDGKPVDAGMVETNMIGNPDNPVKMNPKIQGAQAFAITLEKTGGSPTPTMEELYVLGKV